MKSPENKTNRCFAGHLNTYKTNKSRTENPCVAGSIPAGTTKKPHPKR